MSAPSFSFTLTDTIAGNPMYIAIPNLQARALPAAGAYYTSATAVQIGGQWENNHDGEPSITFRFTYTKGAGSAGGYPVMRIVWIILNDVGTEVEVPDTLTTADPGGVCTTVPATNKLTALTNGNPLTIGVPWVVMRDVTKVRVEVAELGDIAHPGTVTVDLMGRL